MKTVFSSSGSQYMAKKIYLIAGEASGDILGAQLMHALKQKEPDVQFFGIGGPLMQREGLKSLFPMEELSLMGIAEILPRVPKLLARIRQTINDIQAVGPDILVTIDAPDFSFRVQKAVRQRVVGRPKQVHYVAPTVWAWRPKRAMKIAAFLDAVVCLFDFEPPYFEEMGLKAVSVGHPMMENNLESIKPALIGEDQTLKLGVFLGSRQGELKRVAPIIIQSVKQILSYRNDIELIVPTLPHLEEQVTELVSVLNAPCCVSSNPDDKWPVFKACDAAIAVSGTVGLELVAADVPHAIAYKMNPATWEIVKRVIRTPYAHLGNIIADDEVVPEFIQDNCKADDIARIVKVLMEDPEIVKAQKQEFAKIRQQIGSDIPPSEKAADYLLSLF